MSAPSETSFSLRSSPNHNQQLSLHFCPNSEESNSLQNIKHQLMSTTQVWTKVNTNIFPRTFFLFLTHIGFYLIKSVRDNPKCNPR